MSVKVGSLITADLEERILSALTDRNDAIYANSHITIPNHVPVYGHSHNPVEYKRKPVKEMNARELKEALENLGPYESPAAHMIRMCELLAKYEVMNEKFLMGEDDVGNTNSSSET